MDWWYYTGHLFVLFVLWLYLMARTIVYTNTHEVSCDGFDEVQQEATHPLVYYTLKEYPDGIKAACHYCGKFFIYKESI